MAIRISYVDFVSSLPVFETATPLPSPLLAAFVIKCELRALPVASCKLQVSFALHVCVPGLARLH